jgi:peptide/nickel transport system permease protein
MGALGALLTSGMLIMAIAAPHIAPFDPYEQPARRLSPPSVRHWAGTDNLGRDIFSRTVYGARISLYVSTLAVSIAAVAGVTTGSIAGFYRGRLDNLLMRITDILLAFPGIILAIFLAGILGPSLRNSTVAIGIVFAPTFARVARGQTLSVVTKEYVDAARVLGASDRRLIFAHVLPNSVAPLLVQASLSFAAAIVAEASLSFLGLGAQPPEPSWGAMLGEGRRFLETAPWGALVPGAAIAIAVLGLNLFGDGLRDVLDPRLRSR